MKKRILAISVVMICLSILASVTLAYYTDSAIARNVITSGGIDIEVVEQQKVGNTLEPWVDPEIPVMPSQTVSKIVSVENKQQTAWIRASYTLTVFDADKKMMDIPEDELEQVIIITPDSTNWTEKDGWWYCNKAAGTGEVTVPLFKEVTFSGPNMDNKYQGCTVVIEVEAQAVQKANNKENVLEAAGWPAPPAV